MERVRLTKEERRVLRWLQRNDGSKLKQIEKLAAVLGLLVACSVIFK